MNGQKAATTSAELHRRIKIGNADAPEVIDLTPEMAMELLEHNTLNRPLAQQHVTRLAHQIITGKWRFNGDTIKVADTGDVLDGQHRLWAIVESKTTVRTVIVYGVEKEAFSTIDTLRRARSGGDVVALNGQARHRNIIASSLKWLVLWQRGVIWAWRDPKNRIENADIEQALADNPGVIAAVERCQQVSGMGGNRAIYAFMYFVMTNWNAEIADRMIDTLVNPSGVSIDDPFFRLRAWIISPERSRRATDPLMVMALTIKAANAAFEGKSMRSLSWRQQGATPEPFPTLSISEPAR